MTTLVTLTAFHTPHGNFRVAYDGRILGDDRGYPTREACEQEIAKRIAQDARDAVRFDRPVRFAPIDATDESCYNVGEGTNHPSRDESPRATGAPTGATPMITEANTPNSNEFAPSIQMHHAKRAKAARLSLQLQVEYPRLSLIAIEGEQIDHERYDHALGGFRVLHDEDAEIWEGEDLPELADVLDAAQDAGLTDADLQSEGEEEDEEARAPASVVAPAYRAAYQLASSNGQGNGDWLHEALVATCNGSDGISITLFDAVLRDNGIEPLDTKWGTSPKSRGWQGRMRMSGRLALEKQIALSGECRMGDTQFTAESDADFGRFLVTMQTKHAAAIAKRDKAEAKQAAARAKADAAKAAQDRSEAGAE